MVDGKVKVTKVMDGKGLWKVVTAYATIRKQVIIIHTCIVATHLSP